MLYISRLVGYNQLGVVDSDTGKERIIDRDKVVDMITRKGIEVVGASFRTPEGGLSVHASPIPYQSPETVTSIQVKANILLGVDIRVYKGMVTRIMLRTEDIKNVVRLRLSDFGDSVGDYVLFGNQAAYDHILELVIDDGIKSISPRAFRIEVGILSAVSLGVTFDLRELSDYMLAESVYCALAVDNCVPSLGIVDRPDRMDFMSKIYGEGE